MTTDLNAELSTLTDSDLYDLYQALARRMEEVTREQARRVEVEAQAAVETRVVERMCEQRPELKPAFGDTPDMAVEWVQPQGAHDSYPPGAYVLHSGQAWQNVLPIVNPHEPGNDGPVPTWVRIITEPDTPALDGQPVEDTPDGTLERPFVWEPGLVLTRGQYVTYEGRVYVLAQDQTSQDHWRPGPGLESIYTPVV